MESTTLELKVDNAPASQPSTPRPAVSVVVPSYNCGRFLDGLMESLRRQTFRDFEIVLVDDGSTEEETRQKLAALDASVRLIRQENSGPAAARNTGIRAARAELLMTLDCDDTIEPPFLQEAVAAMAAAPADVAAVFSYKRLVGAGSGLLERHFNRFDLLFSNPLPASLLLRKSAWEAAGGYDEGMRDGYEDWEFYLRLMRMGYRAIVIPKPYLNYRVSNSGMLFRRSSGHHAVLWRQIRRKHAAAYRPLAMLRLWWESRDGTGSVSLAKGFAAYLLTAILPDTWYTWLVVDLRRRHLMKGDRKANQPVETKTKVAA